MLEWLQKVEMLEIGLGNQGAINQRMIKKKHCKVFENIDPHFILSFFFHFFLNDALLFFAKVGEEHGCQFVICPENIENGP